MKMQASSITFTWLKRDILFTFLLVTLISLQGFSQLPTVPAGYNIRVHATGGLLAGQNLYGIAADRNNGNIYIAASTSSPQTTISSINLYKVVPAGTVSLIGTYPITQYYLFQMTCGADGKLYMLNVATTKIVTVDPSNGATAVYANAPSTGLHDINFDPNGNLIIGYESMFAFYKIQAGTNALLLGNVSASIPNGNHGDAFGIQPNGNYIVYVDCGGQNNYSVNTAGHVNGTNYTSLAWTGTSNLLTNPFYGSACGYSNGCIDPVTGDVYSNIANFGNGNSRIVFTPAIGGASSLFVTNAGDGLVPGLGITDMVFGKSTVGGCTNSLFFTDRYQNKVYEVYQTCIVPPTVACPSNITISNDPGVCGANVTYPNATATGNPAPTVTYSNASGSFFPVGTTTVTVSASNGIGNTATCTFTVTVTGGTDTDNDGIPNVCDPDDDNDGILDEDDCAPLVASSPIVVTAVASNNAIGPVAPQAMIFSGVGQNVTFVGQGPGHKVTGGRTNIYSNINTSSYGGLWWTFTPIENPRHSSQGPTGQMVFSSYDPVTRIITFTSTANMIWQSVNHTENIATRLRMQLQPYTGTHTGPIATGLPFVTAGGISLGSLAANYPLIDIKALGSPAAYQVWYIIETASGVPLDVYYGDPAHNSSVGGTTETSQTGSFFSSTLSTCNGGPASVTVTATGGTGPYTGTGVFSAAIGEHTYTVTDANGCSGSATITVVPPTPIVVTAVASNNAIGAVAPQAMIFSGPGQNVTFVGQGPGHKVTGGRTNIYSNINTSSYGGLWWTFTPIENPRHSSQGPTGQMVFSSYDPVTRIITFTSTANMIWQSVNHTENIATRLRMQLQPYTGTHTGPIATGLPFVTAGGISLGSLAANYPLIDIKALGSPAAYQVWYIIETASGVPLDVYYGDPAHNSSVGGTTETSQTGSFFSSTLSTCNGGPASVTVTATGGTGPYTGTGVFSATIGEHTYTVTDANGCSGSATITVVPPTPIVVTAVASNNAIGAVAPQAMIFSGPGQNVTFVGQGPGHKVTGGRTNIYSNINTSSYGGLWWTFTPIENPRHSSQGPTGQMVFSSYDPVTRIITFTSTANMIWQSVNHTENIATRLRMQLQPYTGTHTGPIATGLPFVTAGGISLGSLAANYPLINIKALGSPAAYQVWYIIETASGVPLDVYYGDPAHNSSVGGTTETSQTGSFFSSTLSTCNGGPASVTVTATGGTGPYTGTGVFSATIGEHTYTVTDANGCSGSATINVEGQNCIELLCVENKIASTDAGACVATVVNIDPIITPSNAIVNYKIEKDGIELETGVGSVSGKTFAKGITTVTYTAADEPTKTCSFTVTVTDNQQPVIICPVTGNTNRNTDAGVCTYKAVLAEFNATASDNCAVTSLTYTLTGVTTGTGTTLAGVVFNKGITTVTWTASDGVTTNVTCSFTVTVIDNEPPIITCPGNITVNNDPGICGAVVNYGTNEFYCTNNSGTSLVKINTSNGAVTTIGSFGFGNTWALGFKPDGTAWTTVNWGQLASVNLTTGAATPIGAPFGFTAICLDANSSGQLYTIGWDAKLYTVNTTTGALTFIANTGLSSVMDIAFDASNKLWAINSSGNLYSINTTTGLATLESSLSGGILLGEEMGLAISPSGNFYMTEWTSTPRLFSVNPVTGVTTLISSLTASYPHGGDFSPLGGGVTATDNCGTPTVTYSPVSGSAFPIGTTTVTATATDAVGNIKTCSFTVTVADNQQPMIICPVTGNTNRNTDAGACTYKAVLAEFNATASDNCGVTSLTYTLTGVTTGTGTTLAGVVFNKGITNVKWTASDGVTTNVTCSFTVTVIDNEKPTFTCPGNQNVSLNGTCQLVVPNLIAELTGNDNCGTVTFTQSPLAGASFASSHNQTHNVVITASDGNGNTQTCTVILTGKDVTKPIFTCPNDRNVNLNGTCQLIVPNLLTGLTGNDNCGTVTFTQSPLAGASLASSHNQTHNVVITASDGNGNSQTCTVVLTGKDVTAPSITCIDNILVSNDPGVCKAIVNFASPLVTDNCSEGGGNGKIAILYASPYNTDVHNKLLASNQFLQIDDYNVSSGTNPTLAQLMQYQSVIVYSDFGFANPVGLGNVLADYADAGGGVVLATFAFEGSSNLQIGGRLLTGGYLPFDGQAQNQGTPLSLVKILPAHPILAGVNSFSGGSSSYHNSPISTTAGSTLIAQWNNGTDLIATKQLTAGKVVGLNFYTPSSDIRSDFWISSTDGAKILTNSLNWSAKSGVSLVSTHASGSEFPVGTTVVTWTATDVAGNTSTCSFSVTVTDNEKPTVTAPATVDLECSSNLPAPATTITQFLALEGSEADDNCTEQTALLVSSSDGPLVNGNCNGTITRTYTITDAAGNATTVKHVFTVTDNTKPTVTAPTTVDLECSSNLPAGKTTIDDFLSLIGANANDNCTPRADLQVSFADGPLVSGNCNGTITRTYTITDACGNATTVNHVFTVTDNTKPTAAPPNTVDLECSSNLPPAKTTIADFLSLLGANANDNCTPRASLLVSSVDGPLVGNNCYGTITRRYTITDACGNTTTVNHVFTVTDNTIPVINTCPGNGVTFIKNTNAGVCSYRVMGTEFDATGQDNCTGVTMSYSIVNEHNPGTVTGTGSLAGKYLSFGLNTITWIATDGCGNTSVACAVKVDVDKITTTTTLTVNPTSQQYSDLVTFTATVTPNNCTGAGNIGGTVTFKIGSLIIGTAPVINGIATVTDTLIEDMLYDANLNDPMNPTNGPLKPGAKIVTAYFSGTDADYIVTNPTAPLTVTCENADITYNGQTYFSVSPNTNAGTVVLSNYVVDKNDTPTGARGDIRNATATFWQNAINGSVLGTANVPVGLVNPTNKQEGFVTTSFNDVLSTTDISNGGKVYEIWSGLNNYYCENSDTYTPVTLGLPGQDFVTGGGYIVFGNNSAGTYAGTQGKRMNFGFVMKWNSSGKNLQGRVNVVYRKMVNGVQRIYQIKSNAINSLVVENVNDAGSPATGTNIKFRRATISTKANLADITDPLNPISLGGNLSLTLIAWESTTVTTGALDRINVQLSGSGSIGLLFSSNWVSGNTTWQTLNGGKIQVRNPATPAPGQRTTTSEEIIITKTTRLQLLIKAFPNPSDNYFNLMVESNRKEDVVVSVYNVNGVRIHQVKGTANRYYKFGEAWIPGTYLVEVRQGNELKTLKLIKQ